MAEYLSNILARFLHLRGYIDDQNRLTPWGKVLKTALAAAGPRQDHIDGILVAIELLRMGLLSSKDMFKGYSGAAVHGSGKRKFPT
jgi:hypothetical protein